MDSAGGAVRLGDAAARRGGLAALTGRVDAADVAGLATDEAAEDAPRPELGAAASLPTPRLAAEPAGSCGGVVVVLTMDERCAGGGEAGPGSLGEVSPNEPRGAGAVPLVLPPPGAEGGDAMICGVRRVAAGGDDGEPAPPVAPAQLPFAFMLG